MAIKKTNKLGISLIIIAILMVCIPSFSLLGVRTLADKEINEMVNIFLDDFSPRNIFEMPTKPKTALENVLFIRGLITGEIPEQISVTP